MSKDWICRSAWIVALQIAGAAFVGFLVLPYLSTWTAAIMALLAASQLCGVWALAVPSLRRDRARRLILLRVRALMAEGALSIVFQPIVDLQTSRIVGYEALSRFPGGSVGPEQWFSDAETVGLGVELEMTAVRQALAHSSWIPTGRYLALNVSPSTMRTPDLEGVLNRRPSGGPDLVLEITEHVSIADYPAVLSVLARLRPRGVRLAIDDAGAGYASMRHILKLAPEIIKLDRSLIASIDTEPVQQAFVSAVVEFAALTSSEVVAEGVETAFESDALARLGVGFAQGFHFGRPQPHPQTIDPKDPAPPFSPKNPVPRPIPSTEQLPGALAGPGSSTRAPSGSTMLFDRAGAVGQRLPDPLSELIFAQPRTATKPAISHPARRPTR